MVRVNILKPRNLADQHLVAEYLEILMLVGYVRKNPSLENIPEEYCLGEGHIRFFKNKLRYLSKRHEEIKKEMKQRGFKTNIRLGLEDFDKKFHKDWRPDRKDKEIIKLRLVEKIKKKPNFYRYYGKVRDGKFWLKMIKNAS